MQGFQHRSTGGWLAALAAAPVPLRELRLRNGGILPGEFLCHDLPGCTSAPVRPALVCSLGCRWPGSYVRLCRLGHIVNCIKGCSSCASDITVWMVNRFYQLPAGSGAEAAIGQLTRLTSLHMSVDRECTALLVEDDPPTMLRSRGIASVPLQLQLLGCGRPTSNPKGIVTILSSASRVSAVRRNTGLQELALECRVPLSNVELAAAAASLPDLRQLTVTAPPDKPEVLRSLHGARLAAFSACRRLHHISLQHCDDLEAQQLLAQLQQISSLASPKLFDCPKVDGSSVCKLQAAFQAEHDRHLSVQYWH
jgi:hypothetical protein